MSSPFRQLPSVDRLLSEPPVREVIAQVGHETAVRLARLLLDEVRAAIRRGEPPPELSYLVTTLRDRLIQAARPSLQPVMSTTWPPDDGAHGTSMQYSYYGTSPVPRTLW